MNPAVVRRFANKVDRRGDEDCWLWTAAANSTGYGVFSVAGKLGYAHRFAYSSVFGPVPDGFELDHLCNERKCVNPLHLEAVTHRENMRRRSARQTVCIRGHKRAGNLYSGGQCKTCMRQLDSERYQSRKDAA